MAEGLSRRRVAGAGQTSESDAPRERSTANGTDAGSSSKDRDEQSSTASNLGARSYQRGGHKIGYDPKDLETQSEDNLVPKLTLMEEILLLGLKDKAGYLSFWNDSISYTLRGCIIIELALRHRIAMVKDPNRRRFPLPDRFIEVVDERLTGEVLLDEALKMIKGSERMSVGTWIDLMSGETWNVMKIGYQLKQVRERLAKGLVDKGVLRTEKKNFLLFDMATHPVSDPAFKDDVLRRTLAVLTARTAAVPTSSLYSETVRYRTIRAISMVCAAFAANVLENALLHLGYDDREAAFAKCDELLAEYSQYPFGKPAGYSGSSRRRQQQSTVGGGSQSAEAVGATNLQEINRLASAETRTPTAPGLTTELHLEIVAAVLHVYSRMDSLL